MSFLNAWLSHFFEERSTLSIRLRRTVAYKPEMNCYARTVKHGDFDRRIRVLEIHHELRL